MYTVKGDPSKRLTTKQYLSKTLLQGFLVILPLTIIILVLYVVFRFIFNLVAPLSALISPGQEDPHWIFNVIALVILVVFVFMAGLMVQNRVGKVYFKIFERKYLKKIPLYHMVHETVYQFAGVKKLPFSEVVMIDPYKTGTLMTGFITDRITEDLFSVFVPTAPNPMNGNIYHVPRNAVTFLNVSTQDAMRTVVGMGTGTSSLWKIHENHKAISPEEMETSEAPDQESGTSVGMV